MPYRSIIIESPAHISVKNEQLIIRTDSEHSAAVEDITALLIESPRSIITAAALSLLGKSGCSVFVCDERHIPCAVMEPYMQHSRQLHALRNQLRCGEVLKKHLWRSTVSAKIKNQALCLSMCGKTEAAAELMDMSENIRSGDAGNQEAVAAAKYFPALFGRGFTRDAENGINSALNYGYAILRGQTARCLAVYGFVPAFGIHHCSELNAFNLADDMMEPFRPVIDLMAYMYFDRDGELTSEGKRLLFSALNMDILSGNQHHSVSYAIEREIKSLSSSFENGEEQLILPELTELRQHRYE